MTCATTILASASGQLRRQDEGVTAFGLTGEGDENGGEHPITVGPRGAPRHP